MSNHNPYAPKPDPYAKRFDPYAKRFDPYAKRFDPYAQQENRQENVKKFEAGVAAGVIGATIFKGSTAVLGGMIAKGAAAAGLSTIASVGAIPVAGALLLGGATIAVGAGLAAVAGPKLGKGIYNGIKSTMGMLGKGAGLVFDSMAQSNKNNYAPQREQSQGAYNKAVEQNNKASKYLEQTQAKFEKGENTQKELQKISELKGLNRSQKKQVSNQLSDNFLRNVASSNGGKITPNAIAKEVIQHKNENKLTKKEAQKLQHSTLNRLEQHKNMQNVTKSNQVMQGAFPQAKNAQKAAQLKTKIHTQQVGNAIKGANNLVHAQPQNLNKNQKSSSSSAKAAKSAEVERGR